MAAHFVFCTKNAGQISVSWLQKVVIYFFNIQIITFPLQFIAQIVYYTSIL